MLLSRCDCFAGHRWLEGKGSAMTIAKQKKTRMTAAVAAGVLVAGGAGLAVGELPDPVSKPAQAPYIASAAPNPAAMVTPNSLYLAAVSLPIIGGSAPAAGPSGGTGALPGAIGPGAAPAAGGPAAGGGVAPAGGSVAPSSPNLFVPTVFALPTGAPTGGGPTARGASSSFSVGSGASTSPSSFSTLAADPASANAAFAPTAATLIGPADLGSLIGGLIGIFVRDGTEDNPNAGLLIGNGWSAPAGSGLNG